MALQEVAEEYFKSLNPIAARLYDDLNETKEDYESLWEKLTEKEREQILNETIIKPEIKLKYTQKHDKKEEKEKETTIKYASKVIMDDHCSYKDEHSAPFSFRTASQRDLTIFHQPIKEEPKKKNNVMKVQYKYVVKEEEEDEEEEKVIMQVVEPKLALMKQKVVFNNNESFGDCVDGIEFDKSPSPVTDSSLPKTGLDLLDNW